MRERISKPMVAVGAGAKHAKRAGKAAKRSLYDYRYLIYVAVLAIALYVVSTHTYLIPTYRRL